MFVGRSSNCRCQRIGLYIQKPVFSEFEFCYDRNGLSYSRGVEFGLGYSFLFLFSSLLFRLVIGQLKVSFWLVLIRVPNSDSKIRAFFQFALKVWLESIINSCTAAYRRILVYHERRCIDCNNHVDQKWIAIRETWSWQV